MLAFWNFFLERDRFTYLIIGATIALGTYSLLSIPKESAPEVRVPVGIVTTVFPGASAADVEELITNKLEDQLNPNLENLSKLTSSSRESISVIVAEFTSDADIDSAIADIKDEVEKVKRELPTEAEDPIVSDVNFVDQPIMLISVSSDLAPREFIVLADTVADEIKEVKGVGRVEKSGIQKREVQVIVNKEDLARYGVTLPQVIATLSLNNATLPIGSLEIGGIEYALKFEGDIQNSNEIQNLPLTTSNGGTVYLRDIAFISDGVSDASSFSRVSLSGKPSQPAVTLSVFKKSGGDVTKITEEINLKLEEMKSSVLKGAETLVSYDTGEYVKKDLGNLSKAGLETIALILIMLFLSIGLREAIIAGIAIPLSFLMAFVGLQASGNTINFVSLFSLILSVGILVDAAIVVVEAIHTNMFNGMSRREAALKMIRDYSWPLIAGTMTTVAVFFPLFFISGVTGEFISNIPFTIIFVLLAAQFIALAIVPLIASKFLGQKSEGRFQELQEEYTHKLQEWYRVKLSTLLDSRLLQKKFLWGMAIAFVLSLALPIVGIVKVQFFPGEDTEFLLIEVATKQGSTLEQTDLAIRTVEEVLYEESRIDSFVTTVGSGSSFRAGSAGTKYGNITAILKDEYQKEGDIVVNDLRTRFAEVHSAEIGVFKPDSGPPTGAPVLIKFFGDNLDDLRIAVQSAETLLRSIPGTAEVRTSTSDDGLELVLEVDKTKLSEVGLSPVSLAQTLRTAVYGVTATALREGTEDVDLVVKLNLNSDYKTPHDTARANIDALRNLEIVTPKGPVLLGSFIKPSVKESSAVISHEGGERLATVNSQLAPGYFTTAIIDEFEKRKGELTLPEGVRIDIGGENEEVDKSFREMFFALIAGVVLITIVLLLEFNSFRHAGYLVITIPLSLIGVFAGLALTGKALSFPSMMGVIALAGVIVNHSILLIDRINSLRNEKPDVPVRDIIIEAGVTRFRPITLTNLTTITGMIPLATVSGLWGPLAYAVMFGLLFSFILTLVLIPVLYMRSPGTVNH